MHYFINSKTNKRYSRDKYYRLAICNFILFLSLFINSIYAQPGTNDPSFNTFDDGSYGDSSEFNNAVRSSVIQSDGKLIAVGLFTNYNGTVQNRIVRLNTDGSIDTTFNTGNGFNSDAVVVALQDDGKILVGGFFTSYNGSSARRIARLNADGSLDTTFNSGQGANSWVRAIVVQDDGKIVIGGEFTSYDNVTRTRLARLNADGSLDTTYTIGTGVETPIFGMAIQADNKVIIGGQFTLYNGTSRRRLARINTDGSLDTTFDVGTGFNNIVYSIVVKDDGKVIAGGNFTSYNSSPVGYIVQLNTDGSLDTSFSTGTGFNVYVFNIQITNNDKLFISGNFTSYNGNTVNRIVKLNSNGTIDTSFLSTTNFDAVIRSIALQSDGKVIVSGDFTSSDESTRNRIARLNADGSFDGLYNPFPGFNDDVNTTTIQTDGKILVGGDFESFNGIILNRIARLNPDGSIDATFNTGSGFNGNVEIIALQNDGKILVGGFFTEFNAVPVRRLVRLNANGTLDNTFSLSGTGLNNAVLDIALQNDNKILIGGEFTNYDGTSSNRIARLNVNGTLDTSFNIGTGFNNQVTSLVIQNDGKIIAGGNFTLYNANSNVRIIRLNTNGSADNTFVSGTGFNLRVQTMTLQDDGKILVGGFFTSYNGITSPNRIVRLHTDGSIDNAFDTGTGFNSQVNSIQLDEVERPIIGGQFTSFNGASINRIIRLNTDGSLNAIFNTGTGFDNIVNTISLQTDGKIIVGGNFNEFNAITRTRIARLFGGSLYVWNGSEDTLWSNPNNWDNVELPAVGESVLIPLTTNQPLIEESDQIELSTLELENGTELSILGNLKIIDRIVNNGNLAFLSNASSTGQFDVFNGTIEGSGSVRVEHFIPAGLPDLRRAYRFLTSSVNSTGSINANWQEGVTTEAGNPNPNPGYGTHITGGAPTEGFDQNETGNPSMFTFDNSFVATGAETQSDAWSALPNTNSKTLKAGEAYLTFIRGDRSIDVTSNSTTPTNTTLRATGNLHIGPRTFSSANNATTPEYGLSDKANYFSHIGNPYQAIVDFTNLNLANVNSNFYWVWDANMSTRGAYVAVDLSNGNSVDPVDTSTNSTSPANQFIQPGQSFLVQTINDGTASLEFNEDDKDVNGSFTAIFSDTASQTSLNMLLYSDQAYNNGKREADALKINFNENFNNAIDIQDADKMTNPDENLARLHNNELISIENRAMPTDGEILELSTTGYTEDNYTFVVNAANIQSYFEAYLLDNYTGSQTQLNEGATQINFSIDSNIPESVASNRFSLVFENTTFSVEDNSFGSNISLYPNPTKDGRFSIYTPNLSGEVIIEINNLLGQQVYNQALSIENQKLHVNTGNLSTGVYLVKLIQNQQSVAMKLIVE